MSCFLYVQKQLACLFAKYMCAYGLYNGSCAYPLV